MFKWSAVGGPLKIRGPRQLPALPAPLLRLWLLCVSLLKISRLASYGETNSQLTDVTDPRIQRRERLVIVSRRTRLTRKNDRNRTGQVLETFGPIVDKRLLCSLFKLYCLVMKWPNIRLYRVLKLVLYSLLTYKTTAKENKTFLLTAYTNLAHILPQFDFLIQHKKRLELSGNSSVS